MIFRTGLSLALVLLAWQQTAQAGALAFGAPTIESNQYAVPITLSGSGGQVSAMDFRIEYDSTVFRPVSISPGPMALQANKQVAGNGPAPGEYVVIMHGINQNAVGNGEVARVVFERIDGGDAASRLNIVEPTLADANGAELPASGGGRSVGTRNDSGAGSGGGTGGDLDTPAEPGEETPAPAPENPQSAGDNGGGGAVVERGGGGLASPPMITAGVDRGGIVIPTAKRPEPQDEASAAGGNAVQGDAGAAAEDSLNAGGGAAPMSGQNGQVNNAESATKKKIAETAHGDVRIETARLGTGADPIESVNGRAGLAGASAIAGDTDKISPALVAGLAVSALLAAAAMVALRRRLFR